GRRSAEVRRRGGHDEHHDADRRRGPDTTAHDRHDPPRSDARLGAHPAPRVGSPRLRAPDRHRRNRPGGAPGHAPRSVGHRHGRRHLAGRGARLQGRAPRHRGWAYRGADAEALRRHRGHPVRQGARHAQLDGSRLTLLGASAGRRRRLRRTVRVARRSPGMAYEGPRSYRPLIMGRRGAVASNHPLATQAGLVTLQAGGNAVDAAVAVAATLSVVEPYVSGLGGDGFYHVYVRRTREAIVFNGTGPAPAAATPERYAAGIPASGPLGVSVPGSVGAWGAMHARFGRRPWASLFEGAVAYARDGFGASRAYRHFAGEQQPMLAADRRSAAVFLRDGRAPRLGTPIVQDDLARTLAVLAAEGAESFYRGGLAKAVAAGCAEVGTLITADDLAAFEPESQAPIEVSYRGFTVREAPPNSMGWVLLQELNLVEPFDLASMGAAMGPLSADCVHTLVEAKKLAFADRERYAGDPRRVAAPLEELLSKAY